MCQSQTGVSDARLPWTRCSAHDWDHSDPSSPYVCMCVADYAYVAKDLCKLACAMNNKLAARVVFLKRCLSLFRGLCDNEWSAYATRMSQFLLLGCTNQRRSTV